MEQYVKLLAIFERCGKIYSRIKIQKMLYIIKSLGFPVTEEYEYRDYGPYSEELASELRSSVNARFLLEEKVAGPRELGYEPDFYEDEADAYERFDLSVAARGGQFLKEQLSQNPGLEPISAQMAELAADLNKYPPRKLELIATLMFIEDQEGNPKHVVKVLKSLKPQFSAKEIEEALGLIKVLRAERNSSRLVKS